uniref:Uncharacterized protein n=1 Tax=Romanomermis culicivorax TaxID=13658 RepID=A0A915I8L2_ROMCU
MIAKDTFACDSFIFKRACKRAVADEFVKCSEIFYGLDTQFTQQNKYFIKLGITVDSPPHPRIRSFVHEMHRRQFARRTDATDVLSRLMSDADAETSYGRPA